MLHLDCNAHYGGDWASFSFTQLLDWAKSHSYEHDGNFEISGARGLDRKSLLHDSPVIGGRTDECMLPDMCSVGKAIAKALACQDLKKAAERSAAPKTESSDAAFEDIKNQAGEAPVSIASKSAEQPDSTQAIPHSEGSREQDAVSDTPGSTSASWLGQIDKDGDTNNGGFEQSNADEPSVTEPALADTSSRPNQGDNDNQSTTIDMEPRGSEDAQPDAKAVEEAASVRLQSLSLSLLPLRHVGSQTMAAKPSDTCQRERAEHEAAQEAAAAAGRFYREPGPSHPAWLGRPAAIKDNNTRVHSAGISSDPGVDGSQGAEGDTGKEGLLHPSFWGFRTAPEPCAADLVRMSRSFNLDLTSQVEVFLSSRPRFSMKEHRHM